MDALIVIVVVLVIAAIAIGWWLRTRRRGV
jgi:uncharacterized membrane protein YqjE